MRMDDETYHTLLEMVTGGNLDLIISPTRA